MNEKEKQIDEILKYIVNEISITSSMQEKAISSYQAVGSWIGNGINYDVRIMPQGSMNLGTTIKPITDKDDYDIDLVCLLENGTLLPAKDIKNIVGNRLKENKIYHDKILKEGEGKRCWKMQYDEFHMDILPCVPIDYYKEPSNTEIRLTHKITSSSYVDKYSNPYGYKLWFENRMKDIVQSEKQEFAARNNVNIEDVPIYKIKTPLQSAIQLLKRHRDIMFKDDENAPISVIITTLATKAYQGESSIYQTICRVLRDMESYIESRNGVIWIGNPVMQNENFADKWKQYPERKEAFYRWINAAKVDFIENPIKAIGMDNLSKSFETCLGNAPVQRAFVNYANDYKKARSQHKLYSSGLTTGLSTVAKTGSTLVKGHTFFGKKDN